MSAANLQLTIRYREAAYLLVVPATAGTTQTIGRGDLQRWLGLPGDALRNISKSHLDILYRDGRFWINEHSTYGTYVRSLDAPTPPPYRRRRTAQLAIGQRMELMLANTNPADNSPDDVYIFIDNPGASDTLATFVDPLWDQLLRRLETARAVHLLGLPGSGKWHLARQLIANDSRDLERQLGLSILPISIDCLTIVADTIIADDTPIWLAFARRLLTTMAEAADHAGHAAAGATLAELAASLERQPPGRPDETMSIFRRAFTTVVSETLLSPLLVLTHFDGLYSDLEPEMLYCLARLRSEWHEISERIYMVIATSRPLNRLRDDAGLAAAERDDPAADFVREFNHIFSDATLVVQYRSQFRALWNAMTDSRPLNLPAEERLLRLTGGNPGLLADVLQRCRYHRWLDDPARLAERLAQESWREVRLPTADKLWRVLRPDERDDLVAVAEGQPININRQQALARLGLLDSDGRVFSEAFAAAVDRFRAEENRHERGLRVDAVNRRVMVDGQPVALRDGREMDILLALYARRGQVVPYRELIEAVYGEPGVPYDDAMLYSDKEALQRAIGRLCERIDPPRAYLVNKHGVGYSLSTAVA